MLRSTLIFNAENSLFNFIAKILKHFCFGQNLFFSQKIKFFSGRRYIFLCVNAIKFKFFSYKTADENFHFFNRIVESHLTPLHIFLITKYLP